MYNVTLHTLVEHVKRASRRFDNPLMKGGFTLSGDVLARAGIQLPVLYAQTGISLAIEEGIEHGFREVNIGVFEHFTAFDSGL